MATKIIPNGTIDAVKGVKVDGYFVQWRHMRQQLRCVVRSYPLWSGSTIGHNVAKACEIVGWIVRDDEGSWIPTAKGLRDADRD